MLLVLGFALLLKGTGRQYFTGESRRGKLCLYGSSDVVFVWLLCGFQMDGENELRLQMVHCVVNCLDGSPF